MIWRMLKWLVTPQRRPLSAIHDGAKLSQCDDGSDQLGLEAIDMDHVIRVERRNQALENTTDAMSHRRQRGSFMAAANIATPTTFKDDADYTRRFHQMFQKSKDTDNDR